MVVAAVGVEDGNTWQEIEWRIQWLICKSGMEGGRGRTTGKKDASVKEAHIPREKTDVEAGKKSALICWRRIAGAG